MIGVILSIIILILFVLYKIFEDEFTPLRKIPKVEGSLPVFGHMFTFLRKRNHLKLLEDWSEKHGPIFRYSRGFGYTRVYLTDPELIKQVLVSNAGNYEITQMLKKSFPSTGNGLLSSTGKDHARQRKTINPAFHFSNLAGMVEDFKHVTDNLVKLWSGQLEDQDTLEVPIQTDLTHLTLDIIGRCAFGYNFNTVLTGDTGISKAFTLLIEGFTFGRIFRRSYIPLYDYLPFAETKRFKEALEKTDRTVLEVIREKRKRKEQGISSSKRDLLDLLLDLRDDETGSAMDDEQLKAQVFTFMLAGHETSSISMTWTLYELARHPDIAEKIREEVHKVFRDSVKVTWSKLAELEFLGNVIKESLRLHSPVTMALRIAKNKDVIGGYEIPKGTVISIGINSVHLSPKLWKDPHAFDPFRFDKTENESQAAVLPYTFVPFSAGPRSCIGNKFAIAEMKVVLATLVQHFTFEEIPGFTVTPIIRLTAKPDPPLRLRIKKVVTTRD